MFIIYTLWLFLALKQFFIISLSEAETNAFEKYLTPPVNRELHTSNHSKQGSKESERLENCRSLKQLGIAIYLQTSKAYLETSLKKINLNPTADAVVC